MDRGEAAVELLRALIRGTGFPASVPDTMENRELYEGIQRDIENMPDGISPEIPWDYNDPPDPEPIAQLVPVPQIEQYASTITGQLDLSQGNLGILSQVFELAGSQAWRHERRGPHGQWVGDRSAAVRHSPNMMVGSVRMTQRQAMANRAAAQSAVASRIAEERAGKALEEARAEVEKVTQQLRAEAKTEEQAKHRTKLAIHGMLIIGGAILAAVMAHFDISPVIASFAGAMPILGIELTDWKKKL